MRRGAREREKKAPGGEAFGGSGRQRGRERQDLREYEGKWKAAEGEEEEGKRKKRRDPSCL